MTPHFRSAVLAAGLSALALSSAAQAEDLQKLSVVLGYVPDVESFGPEYAKEKGYFKDEGLDVTLIPAGIGVDQVQMVAAGQADIGIVGPELILAGEAKGEKFKVIGAEFQRTPVAMTCRKDSGITDPAGLKGHTLGVKQNTVAFGDLFLKKNGIDKADVKVTAIGPNDIAQIIAGRVDCMITTFAFNEPKMIEDAGVPVNVISLGDYGLNAQTNSYFVKASFYDKPGSKEILEKYMRAEIRAWGDFFKDPTAAAKFMVNGGFADGLDMDQQIFQAKAQVDYMTGPLTKAKGFMWLDPKVWAETAENVHEAGITDTVVDTAPMLTNDVLAAIDAPKY